MILTYEQQETRAREALERHRQTTNHQLHLCDDVCHYLTWALFELDNAITSDQREWLSKKRAAKP